MITLSPRKRYLLIGAVIALLAIAVGVYSLARQFKTGVPRVPFTSKPITFSFGAVTVRDPNIQILLRGLKHKDEPESSPLRFVSLDKFSIERGTIEFVYEPKHLRISATGASLAVANLSLTGSEARVDASAPGLVLDFTSDSGSAKTFSLANPSLTGRASFAPDRKLLAIRSFTLTIPPFGSLTGSSNVLMEKPLRFTASLTEQGIDISALFTAFADSIPASYRTWTAQGTLSGTTMLNGSYAEGLVLKGKQTITLAGGGLLEPRATKGIQGMGLSAAVDFDYTAVADRMNMTLNAAVENGEYLVDKWYRNFQGRKATATLQGVISPGDTTRSELKGSVDPFGVGPMGLTVAWKGGDRQLGIEAKAVSIPVVIETFLADYLKEVAPALSDMSVSGSAAAAVSIRQRDKALHIGGNISIADASFGLPSKKIFLTGITARIPIDLSLSGGASGMGPSAGSIAIRKLQVYDVTTPNLGIPLTVTSNTITTAAPVTISLAGGTVILNHCKVAGIPDDNRSVEASLTIASVWINQLFRELNIAPEDVLYADFPLIRYQSDRITSDGAVSVSVFGGDIMVTNLFVDKPFAESRRWGGDIAFSGIDLDRMTARIPIGKMTGVVAGSLRNLEIEYNQPSRFVFDLDSVPTKGISQSISVEAIESISIIGTGVGGFLKRGVITSFFKFYPYSRIGIRATCVNDVFTVRGKIIEGGKEYLVKRGFLRGVDVVNQNPDNTISFKDMQERVERVMKDNQAEKPVIQ